MKKRISLLIAFIYFLTAVSTFVIMLFYYAPAAAEQQAEEISQVTVALGEATQTPYQPVEPTGTPTPTSTPTNTPTPTSTPTSTPTAVPPTPTEWKMVQLPPGKVNIVLLGTDQRNDPGFRTDVILFVSVDTGRSTVSVISFPRDLYVNIPGWGANRINTAMYHGFPTLASTFETNFHIRPDYYFITNFSVFTGMIDSLDGISVNASAPLRDKCDVPKARGGYCTVEPGRVVMDGQTALWYVRSRHSTSDFDRTRRAQEVLYAIFTRMMKFNAVEHLPDLYQQYRENVDTNMSLDDMARILPVASAVLHEPERIHRYTITPQMVANYITPGGAMVLLPNHAIISSMINQAMSGE